MLGNEAFDRSEIAKAHRTATIRRMAEYGGTILAVQDTTGVNYDNHLKTKGIGYISDKTLGVNIHTCLAVTADGLVAGGGITASICPICNQKAAYTESGKNTTGYG